MKNIVQVESPSFYINEDNPYEVSYNPNLTGNIKWKCLRVGSFVGNLPKVKDSDIFYLYDNSRGCIIDGKQYRRNKINKFALGQAAKTKKA